jgi:flavin reductase (DIM6/NTAB) family NADH-FMN oxidoreductase RutF
MLSIEQQAVASAFGGRLRGRERFSEGEWLVTVGRIPTLVGAQANLFATVAKVVPYGTHGIVIGTVEDVLVQEKIAPLLYQNGRYARSALITQNEKR